LLNIGNKCLFQVREIASVVDFRLQSCPSNCGVVRWEFWTVTQGRDQDCKHRFGNPYATKVNYCHGELGAGHQAWRDLGWQLMGTGEPAESKEQPGKRVT
jgi:hypothetical protein